MDPNTRPQASFTSLPSELLNQILENCLVADCPIVIWRGIIEGIMPETMDPDPEYVEQWLRIVDPHITARSLSDLAIELLSVNRMLSAYASSIFYTKNTFSFVGQHRWHEVVTWLTSIGPRQRGLLANLQLTANVPRRCWQRADGSRVWPRGTPEDLYPRPPSFALHELPCSEGEVENINPAIESVFTLLRDVEGPSRPTTRLELLLGYSILPGLYLSLGISAWNWQSCSLDLPNLIETLRRRDDAKRPINVIWRAQLHRRDFTEHRSSIEQAWTIVEARHATEKWEVLENPGPCRSPQPGHTFATAQLVELTVRRDSVPDPLIAAEPFQSTDYHHYQEARGPPWPFHVETTHDLGERDFDNPVRSGFLWARLDLYNDDTLGCIDSTQG